MSEARLGEDALIAALFAPLADAPGADALRDDAATFEGGDADIVVTTDALASGVHFFADDPADAIAAKALRVSLSDLAAKGAEPFGYVLALALEVGWTLPWAEAFSRGLKTDNARYGVSLLGGDTLRAAGGTTVALTAFGRLPKGSIVRRRTARVGDVVTVTGTIGDAALGLACRTGALIVPDNTREPLDHAYLYPEPPVAAFQAVRRYAHAAMDISDGLCGDLGKLVRTAGVGAVLHLDCVPLSPAVREAVESHPHARDIAVTGGDDYQILATMPRDRLPFYRDDLRRLGFTVAIVGEIVSGSGLTVLDRGEPVALADRRYAHF